ncbi:unnamed protein product [Arabidopsis halleri]
MVCPRPEQCSNLSLVSIVLISSLDAENYINPNGFLSYPWMCTRL